MPYDIRGNWYPRSAFLEGERFWWSREDARAAEQAERAARPRPVFTDLDDGTVMVEGIVYNDHATGCYYCRTVIAEAHTSNNLQSVEHLRVDYIRPLDISENMPQNEEVAEDLSVEEEYESDYDSEYDDEYEDEYASNHVEDSYGMTLISETALEKEEQPLYVDDNCEACKLKALPYYAQESGTTIRQGVLRNYSYEPTWRMLSEENDPFSYFLGVELETDSHFVQTVPAHERAFSWQRDRIENSAISQALVIGMRNPRNMWIAKEDASISGPEFVSHPATLTYWHNRKPQLAQMFKMLIHAGYRSHDNDKCGMHINISKSAFDDAKHLYRFLTLVHFSPAWSRRMSQRTAESAAHWAALDLSGEGEAKEKRRQLAKWAMQGPNVDEYQRDSYGMALRDPNGWSYLRNPDYTARPYVDRHTAVNIDNGPRVEFRLPRGTLRIDRFFKNLEWTTGMVEYTRNVGVLQSRPKAFMDWVMEGTNRPKYPHLAQFLTERAPKLKAASLTA